MMKFNNYSPLMFLFSHNGAEIILSFTVVFGILSLTEVEQLVPMFDEGPFCLIHSVWYFGTVVLEKFAVLIHVKVNQTVKQILRGKTLENLHFDYCIGSCFAFIKI